MIWGIERVNEADHPGEMCKWRKIRGNPKVGLRHHGTQLQESGLSVLLVKARCYCNYLSQAKDHGHLLGNWHMTKQTKTKTNTNTCLGISMTFL